MKQTLNKLLFTLAIIIIGGSIIPQVAKADTFWISLNNDGWSLGLTLTASFGSSNSTHTGAQDNPFVRGDTIWMSSNLTSTQNGGCENDDGSFNYPGCVIQNPAAILGLKIKRSVQAPEDLINDFGNLYANNVPYDSYYNKTEEYTIPSNFTNEYDIVERYKTEYIPNLQAIGGTGGTLFSTEGIDFHITQDFYISAPVASGGVEAPSGNLTASDNCTIVSGGTACRTILTWSVTNPIAGANTAVTNNGTQESFGVSPNGATVYYPSTDFYLYHNGAKLKTITVNATCTSGTTWNGNICAPNKVTLSLTNKSTNNSIPVSEGPFTKMVENSLRSFFGLRSTSPVPVATPMQIHWEAEGDFDINTIECTMPDGSPVKNKLAGDYPEGENSFIPSPNSTTTYSVTCEDNPITPPVTPSAPSTSGSQCSASTGTISGLTLHKVIGESQTLNGYPHHIWDVWVTSSGISIGAKAKVTGTYDSYPYASSSLYSMSVCDTFEIPAGSSTSEHRQYAVADASPSITMGINSSYSPTATTIYLTSSEMSSYLTFPTTNVSDPNDGRQNLYTYSVETSKAFLDLHVTVSVSHSYYPYASATQPVASAETHTWTAGSTHQFVGMAGGVSPISAYYTGVSY